MVFEQVLRHLSSLVNRSYLRIEHNMQLNLFFVPFTDHFHPTIFIWDGYCADVIWASSWTPFKLGQLVLFKYWTQHTIIISVEGNGHCCHRSSSKLGKNN